MSMLAERRRKTKWIINPTKKPIWTTDSEGIKLGKQLMEKMGWSAGKGLGAKEQGIQEPLKVSYKNDTKGMGFKGNDEDWMEHQDEFNSLLSQLRGSDSNKPAEVDKNEIKSLEEKSKHSRARVHYQKFTRGKDLSRYSETDLACILGINHRKQKNSVKEKNPVEEKTNGNYETSFGVTTINSGSILDYFKKKWTIDKPKENNSSEALNEVIDDTFNNTDENRPTSEHKKSKKRKLDELDGQEQVPEDGTIRTEVENSEVGEEVKKNKTSKKQKLAEVDCENIEVSENKIVEASEEVTNVCDSEIEKQSKKHKKSKKKTKEDLNTEFENVSKGHKKKKFDADNCNQIEEHNQDIQVENVSSDNNLSVNDGKYESSQLSGQNSKDDDENFTKKKKKDKTKLKIKEVNAQDENLEPVQEVFDHKMKKKKKKDKEKREKDHVAQSEVKEVSGESYSDKHNSLTECDEPKSISNGGEEIQKVDLVEDTAMRIAEDLESEKSRKGKRRKEKHELDQSKVKNEEERKIKGEIEGEETEYKSKNKKRREKLSDESLIDNEEELEIKTKSTHEEIEPVVKEKKKKGKHRTEESKLKNEEQEAESKTISEEMDEFKIKEKRKKGKHRSDQSTVENEQEHVVTSESVPEETESKVKEKNSKKKKSKHRTYSEGVDKSNMNSESVQETNDNINTIEKQSEKLKKVEIGSKLKEDCNKLADGNKAKKDESKTVENNRIHSHKVELFKKKKLSLIGGLPKTPKTSVMNLIFGAEFEKFKGANIESLVGYGMKTEIRGKGDG